VNAVLCNLTQLLGAIVNFYTILLFVYAVLSWIPGLGGRWAYYLAAVIEPVLVPVRRIIPPIGGFDLAFLVVILVLQFLVRPAIGSAIFNTCLRPY